MSVEKITKTVLRCRCELPNCPSRDPKTGIVTPWESKDEKIPARCPRCGRHSWNGVDRRRWAQVRIPPPGSTTKTRNLIADQKTGAKTRSVRIKVDLPKPRKVRNLE